MFRGCFRWFPISFPEPGNVEIGNYIKQALKMFQNAKNIGIVADQPALQRKIKEDLNVLTSFCKLNGIILKKESK